MTAFGPTTVLDQPDRAIVDQLGDEITAFNFAANDIHDGLEVFAAVRDEDGSWLRASMAGRGVVRRGSSACGS